MKTILWTSLITLLLALDWAALHDILKGEPNLFTPSTACLPSARLLSRC